MSHNLMYRCSCKGDPGTNRLSQCQNDLSGPYGPTSHRIFQSACCSPASGVSVLPLPCASFGPASPPCPPHLSTATISLLLSLCQHAHTDRTFRKSDLERDVPGPEAIEEGFSYVGTTAPQVESTSGSSRGVPGFSSQRQGTSLPCCSLRPVLWRYLSQFESFTPTLTSTQDTFKVLSMGVATSFSLSSFSKVILNQKHFKFVT